MEHEARPPARFSSLRSPKNTTIHPLEYAKTVNMVTRQELLFVHPTADAPTLQGIVKASSEHLVGMAVADEAGIELDGLLPK